MSFPPIDELLPHRPPMLWVDEVVAHEGDEVRCRLTLRSEHVFLTDGEAEPIVAVEWMAQTVAALVGLFDRTRAQVPRPGYLIAIPEAQFFVASFAIGDVLDLWARRVWGDDTLASFEAQVVRVLGEQRELAAKAQLSVYRRALPDGQAP